MASKVCSPAASVARPRSGRRHKGVGRCGRQIRCGALQFGWSLGLARTKNLLLELIIQHVVTKRLVNGGSADKPIWECEYCSIHFLHAMGKVLKAVLDGMWPEGPGVTGRPLPGAVCSSACRKCDRLTGLPSCLVLVGFPGCEQLVCIVLVRLGRVAPLVGVKGLVVTAGSVASRCGLFDARDCGPPVCSCDPHARPAGTHRSKETRFDHPPQDRA
jgi:hypothetical protein